MEMLTGKDNYENADIVFRIYPNQLFGEKNAGGYYCFEVIAKEFGMTDFEGQYTSSHPQAAQDILDELLAEQVGSGRTLTVSNELVNGAPYPDSQDKNWFDQAIKNALSGKRKYKGMPLQRLNDDRLVIKSFQKDGYPKFFWKDGVLRTDDVLIDVPFMFDMRWEVAYFTKDSDGNITLNCRDGGEYDYCGAGYFEAMPGNCRMKPAHWVYLPSMKRGG